MRTAQQIHAGRENAKKSTGPRTPAGKARSSQNALKHGLLAQDAVLPGEDPADFDQQLVGLEETYLPRNRVEKEIVRQIADAMWRLQRLSRIETAVIAAGIENSGDLNRDTGPMPEDRPSLTRILGHAILTRTKLLNNLARYDAHLGRRFYRGVELMIDIRREERKDRETREAANSDTTPVHYLPDEAEPNIQTNPPVIGFRPAEKLGPMSKDVPSAAKKGTRESNPLAGAKRTAPQFFGNPEQRNEAKTNLTSSLTTHYKQPKPTNQ